VQKSMILIRRRADLSFARFDEHWATTHADIVRRYPGIEEYVQNPVVTHATVSDGHVDIESRSLDGIAELWFADGAPPPGVRPVLDELIADEARFLAHLTGFATAGADGYDPEAKVWVIGDETTDVAALVGGVAHEPFDFGPSDARLMRRPGLEHEPAAPALMLALSTPRAAATDLHEAVVRSAAASRRGRVRVLLTHSRRIL